MDYKSAGVDICSGDAFAEYIRSVDSPSISPGIGGFAGGTALDLSAYEKPILLSSTDGVGTKLLVAARVGVYSTLGVDLVAMCVNDLLVCGAKPLQFLDYIACGSLSETPLREIIDGIVRGCEQAGCPLVGGETAEMPDVYGSGQFDLAGFVTGIVERDRMLPDYERIATGDPIYGVASSGLHSNGFSLARRALADAPETIWHSMLTPTRIYSEEWTVFRTISEVSAAAHITGGGLAANIDRVLPEGLTCELTYDWPVPPIFDEVQHRGHVSNDEMHRVFNMGIGLAIVVERGGALEFDRAVKRAGIQAIRIGTVTRE